MQSLKLTPSHLTNRNKVILILAVLFSAVSLYGLFKVQPKDEGQSRKMLAILVDQKKFVSRKYNDSLSFIEINQGENLFDGDQIFTGENSTAKVVFQKSGNILTIPPRGLVKIVEGTDGESVDIQKGLAEFVIQKGQSMDITQGTETITLKNDENETGVGKLFFKDNKFVLQMDSGKISLNDSEGKVQQVKKDESFSFSNEVAGKALELTNPVSGQKIDIWSPLTLEWSGRGAIDAVLFKDRQLNDVVAKTTADKSPFNWMLSLQEGLHYLVVNPKGSDKQSVVIPLEMISANKITTFTPADNTLVKLKRGDNLKLSWNAVPASRYKITISTDGDEKMSFMTDIAEYEIKGVKGASLSWSVAPQLRTGVMLKDSATNHIKLVFNDGNTIISPKRNQKFLLGKENIEFIWTASKNEHSNIKLINLSLNQVVFEKEVLENKMVFTPLVPGNYSFIVSSKDFPSAVPLETSFSVNSRIAQWEINAPVELSSIDPEAKRVELKFIPINKNLTEYELSIYNGADLNNKILTSKVSTSKIIYTVKAFGTFCLILKPLKKVSEWLPSTSQCIIYSEQAPFDTIAATKNVVLKFQKVNGVGSYRISLPEIQNATAYEIQVFNKTKKIIFSERSKSNIIIWPSNKAGVFYYRYRVMDSKKRMSPYSVVSKLIFPISPLTDWKE